MLLLCFTPHSPAKPSAPPSKHTKRHASTGVGTQLVGTMANAEREGKTFVELDPTRRPEHHVAEQTTASSKQLRHPPLSSLEHAHSQSEG